MNTASSCDEMQPHTVERDITLVYKHTENTLQMQK